MRVLLLSPYPEMLTHALEEAGDTIVNSNECDFIVAFGLKQIIGAELIGEFSDRIINIHISLLPWNRGSDPNFWSWFDDTPKGVTIHQIDEGIDTGPILVQEEVKRWHKDETLYSSYNHLMARAKALFESEWKNIRRQALARRHVTGGTYHKTADKKRWFDMLPDGWHTPVQSVERLGRNYRDMQNEKKDRDTGVRKYRQTSFKEL